MNDQEEKIKNLCEDIVIKTLQLDLNKKDNNLEDIIKLSNEINNLKLELFTNKQQKHSYFVVYTVNINDLYNITTSETFDEYIYLDIDLNINLPDNNNWRIDEPEILNLLTEIMLLLKQKFDNIVVLLKVIRQDKF
jgi:hypothetical protein